MSGGVMAKTVMRGLGGDSTLMDGSNMKEDRAVGDATPWKKK
jgi:hypothetical protein